MFGGLASAAPAAPAAAGTDTVHSVLEKSEKSSSDAPRTFSLGGRTYSLGGTLKAIPPVAPPPQTPNPMKIFLRPLENFGARARSQAEYESFQQAQQAQQAALEAEWQEQQELLAQEAAKLRQAQDSLEAEQRRQKQMAEELALGLNMGSAPGLRLDESKLFIGRKELGKGAFGVVVAGEYAGEPVAVCLRALFLPVFFFLTGFTFTPCYFGFFVQVKILSTVNLSVPAKRMLLRETAFAQGIRHRRVVITLGTVLRENDLLLVTEWCELGSLDDVLHNPAHLPRLEKPGERLRLAKEICAGIAFLHSLSVLHSDIKPANFLLDKHFEIKVCDLGLSKFLASHDNDKVYGCTPLYSPPECLKFAGLVNDDPDDGGPPPPPVPPAPVQRAQIGLPADVYAVALVLYEVLTGLKPWRVRVSDFCM
jgi:hypothetical protein